MKPEDLNDHTRYVSRGSTRSSASKGLYELIVWILTLVSLGRSSVCVCVCAPRRFFFSFESNRGLAQVLLFRRVGTGCTERVEN